MKIIGTLGLAVAVSVGLMQSAEARGFGGGGHFSGGGAHFSGGAHYSGGGHYSGGARYSGGYSGGARYYGGGARYSGPSRSYAGPSRSFSNGAGRYYGAGRNNVATGVRNPTYASGSRQFTGNRTTAFNSRNFSRGNANLGTGNRAVANRSNVSSQGRVIGRYNASTWHRNWSHGHDHFWNGHRCHFHNGFWFVYDPFPYWYPWDYYGYYPYDYYDSGYYDQGAYPQEQVYTAPADTKDSEYAVDSQVSNVQSALAHEGYYDGPIDGRLGPATRNALRRYQRDHRLDVTGGINQSVVQALGLH